MDTVGGLCCIQDCYQLPECGAYRQPPKIIGCCAPGAKGHDGKCDWALFKESCINDNRFCRSVKCYCDGHCSSSCGDSDVYGIDEMVGFFEKNDLMGRRLKRSVFECMRCSGPRPGSDSCCNSYKH